MAYKTQSVDTSPETEKAYFDLLRRAGVSGRYVIMASWSDAIIALSRAAIAKKHPHWSEREVKIELARQQYGEDIVSAFINE